MVGLRRVGKSASMSVQLFGLRQMAQKGKDREDNVTALMQKAMSTAQKLFILLVEAKAAAEEEAAKNAAEPRIEEDPEFSHQNELEWTTISPES